MRASRSIWATTALLTSLAASTAVFAQETTGGVRGRITDASGAPVAGATVAVIHEPSGTRSVAVTGVDGSYNARGLRVGGPYRIEATSDGATQTAQVDAIGIGAPATLDISFVSATTQLDEIVVTASGVPVQTAIGPNAVFTAADLASAPAINRDLRDVIAIDPRIYIDEANVDAIQCAGANPRFNSLTVDGVRLNDNFGLNNSGYPTERMPFSYDAIEQVSVELAPFNVEYGRFTACNINAVTRSGGNRLSGGMFYDFTNQDLTGDSLEGDAIDLGRFDETRWGVYLGGPIIQDRLFFFGSYEKLEGTNVFSRGPSGSGAGSPVPGLSMADYNEILDIARNVYGYDPGGIPMPQGNEDEKILVKLDWNISDRHRAAFTYNHNEGYNIVQSDGGSANFEFSDHLYSRGSTLDAYIGQMFSDWTDSFSTELRIAYSELANAVVPQGGYEIGEVQITTQNTLGGVTSQATVFMGADDSRQSNVLEYSTWNFKLGGVYTAGDHTLTFGYEREDLEVFNLFVQHTLGEFRFNSINDFRNGLASRVEYGNARSLNPNDAAAAFSYTVNTLYMQDEARLTDRLTVTAGLRYDWYVTDDAPAANANFLSRYGYSNTATIDGEGLLQPRFGFTYDHSPNLEFRGGFGLYSGGNPNVWLSNNYSNDGVTNIQQRLNNVDLFAAGGRPLFDVPPALVNMVSNGVADSGVNALNPAFNIPSEWKFALGATWWFDAPVLGEGVRLDVDVLHSEGQDSAIVRDIAMAQVGQMADGRPIYRRVDFSDPACFTSPSTCATRGGNDFLLTNAEGGTQTTFSAGLSQSYDWGLDWTLGYAYTRAKDVSPMTSSVAFSNFENIGVFDPNHPALATSNYEIPHRITLSVNYERAFFGDYMTRFTLFGRANQGQPYSYTFTNGGGAFGDGVDRHHLLYVPTGASDPNVIFAPTFDQAAFFDFLAQTGLDKYAGSTAPRNAFHSDWWTKFDLRIEQELPGLMAGHRTSAFLVIENLGNLLNDEWGVLREASFPQNLQAASVTRVGSQYQFDQFFTPSQTRVADASLWEIRVGLRYSF